MAWREATNSCTSKIPQTWQEKGLVVKSHQHNSNAHGHTRCTKRAQPGANLILMLSAASSPAFRAETRTITDAQEHT